MINKTCFKCHLTQPISNFYKHPKTKDGYLHKCKECTKTDRKTNYSNNRLYYSKYDQDRFKQLARKIKMREYQRLRREREPLKYKARSIVASAITKGLIQRLPCKICGNSNSQAHHNNYSKPLEIEWFCFKHHRELKHNQIVTVGDTHG